MCDRDSLDLYLNAQAIQKAEKKTGRAGRWCRNEGRRRLFSCAVPFLFIGWLYVVHCELGSGARSVGGGTGDLTEWSTQWLNKIHCLLKVDYHGFLMNEQNLFLISVSKKISFHDIPVESPIDT